MKHRQVVFLTVINIVAVFLTISSMPLESSARVWSAQVGAAPAGHNNSGRYRTLRDDLHASQVANAASAIAEATFEVSWPMAAANPQRTSWTPEEVRGQLYPIWYKPIEPYIPPRVQVIAANNTLFISTARGLYALDAATGAEKWVYPTEMPLGHSPTIHNGVAYVGGFDRTLHAIDASTGQGLWTFRAESGFQTNPLVVNDIVYAGNRDGYLYAVYSSDHPNKGTLAWKFKTGGPVLFSAAYKDNVIYFASNDSYAYALNAQTGTLVWKSPKLPGAGFHSWWPVVYQDPGTSKDVIVLAGSHNYRGFLEPAYGFDLQGRELADVYAAIPEGQTIAPIQPDGSMDVTRVLEYFEQKPWRRTYFVLDAASGEEFTFSYQRQDGTTGTSFAPILWHGTHSGNRYPPLVGSDSLLYQPMHYISNPFIGHGGLVGWQLGASSVRTISYGDTLAMDEPIAFSAGGNLIYWNLCCDRQAGAFDITTQDVGWTYFSYNLESLIPGYNILYETVDPNDHTINQLYRGPNGSINGIYGQHGDQNPPIPYQDKVYMHRSNAVIAFGDYGGQPVGLPMAQAVDVENGEVAGDQLRQKLAVEIQKILDAGHLRPGYRSVGLFDPHTRDQVGDYLIDYWHYPSDTLYALILALPHLPADLQEEVQIYLRNEYAAYPPQLYTHIGWRDGAAREPFDLPAEVESDLSNHPPWISGWGFQGWTWPPHMFYALWKYAQVFGSAQEIFESSKTSLESPPPDSYLIDHPYVHNAYIAGYLGYLELEKLAGHPESPHIRAELDRLLNLRAATFSKDTPFTGKDSDRTLSVARNFMYLVPELGAYLHNNVLGEVQEAVDEYNEVAPYWFVSNFESTRGEGVIQHLYDYYTLFQAKAFILKESREELVKYLDVPGVQVGDLFYIQNLVAAIEAPYSLEKTASQRYADQGATITYTLSFFGTDNTLTLTDTLSPGVSAPGNFELAGTSVTPAYDNVLHRLTWSDAPPAGQAVTIRYSVVINTSDTLALVNLAELSESGGDPRTATAVVLANPYLVHLPLILKEIIE